MSTPVDNLIAEWKSYLTNISSNIMELTDKTEYQHIKNRASDRNNGYTGVTMEKAAKCVERVSTLWQHFAILSEVVERAVVLNNKQGLLYNPEEDVRELFDKTPVVVDKQHVDITSRDLLGEDTSEKRAYPRELLKQMQESFEELRRDIFEISNAESTLQSRLVNIKRDIERLNETVIHLGITGVPVFDANALGGIERDPLKGHMELDKHVYNLEKYRASIKDLEEEYKNIMSRLDMTGKIIHELRDTAEKSRAAVERSRELFENYDYRSVIGEDIIKSLEDWQEVLSDRISSGNLRAVGVGLSRLEGECREKLQMERENCSHNSRVYGEWLDVRGQFSALMAKAEALKARGMLMDGAMGLAFEIEKAMQARPIDMNILRELIKRLGLSL